MSCMICARCSKLVDTDFDLDGRWGDTDYTCEACCEREERFDGEDEGDVVAGEVTS